jgi:hypothetical protein
MIPKPKKATRILSLSRDLQLMDQQRLEPTTATWVKAIPHESR